MRSLPYPLGVTLVEGGANVAVFSETADSIDLCVFETASSAQPASGQTASGQSAAERRVRLTQRTGNVFHDFVPGVTPGTRYGLRADGPWSPDDGLRHNAHKLLLDPYARAIEGDYQWGQAVFGQDFDDPTALNDEDSAPFTPRCVVVDTAFDWDAGAPDVAPRRPLDETIIYETHVKGFTAQHPDVPEEIRGTYAGLAHPAALEHLTSLGVTAVELMPVHQFVQDSILLDRGLRNYWGYNSIGFFAPHNEYSASGSGGGQVAEFKQMVKAMHAAGLEVILDVVYNHTAEGNHLGPTLSFKGLDNPAYYRLVGDDRASYFDTTGTGNSLNVAHPAALGLIMDSLRYWVTDMHVDGFRFDLATTLTRQDGSPELQSAFLTLIQQDPVLAPIKMIAEPWDTAGYQLGGFPAGWSEWNGKYRDDVRDFWRGADEVLGTLSQRVLGSPDVYEASRRAPLSSVNFVTAHDGFTLADLTAYDQKHNSANGEHNADGTDDNRSSNNGAEGLTTRRAVNSRRMRQRRNFFATLLLSAGVPMILGGDEIGRMQGGNNNAYCQDNAISWFDWEHADHALNAFVSRLIRLRADNPALRPPWYRHALEAGGPDLLQLLRSDANAFSESDWENPDARSITFVFQHPGADSFALLLNAAENGVEFTLPDPPGELWQLEMSSDDRQKLVSGAKTMIVRDTSFTLLRSPAKVAAEFPATLAAEPVADGQSPSAAAEQPVPPASADNPTVNETGQNDASTTTPGPGTVIA